MSHRPSKDILELKKMIGNQQANVRNIYNICSALYQEIQDIKRFVNFKHEDSLGEVESSTTMAEQGTNQLMNRMQNQLNVLDNVEEFADNMPKNRKLKIINN